MLTLGNYSAISQFSRIIQRFLLKNKGGRKEGGFEKEGKKQKFLFRFHDVFYIYYYGVDGASESGMTVYIFSYLVNFRHVLQPSFPNSGVDISKNHRL